MSKIWAITVKGEEAGVDGINNYRWATEKQFRTIMSMLQDETKQNAWVTLCGRPLQIGKIKDFKPMQLSYAKSLPSFDKKLLDEIEEEKLLEAPQEKQSINEDGVKRLEALKNKFSLDKRV